MIGSRKFPRHPFSSTPSRSDTGRQTAVGDILAHRDGYLYDRCDLEVAPSRVRPRPERLGCRVDATLRRGQADEWLARAAHQHVGDVPCGPGQEWSLPDHALPLSFPAPRRVIAAAGAGIRSDARAAEGAPLLREYRVYSSIEGSNPSHSATLRRWFSLTQKRHPSIIDRLCARSSAG